MVCHCFHIYPLGGRKVDQLSLNFYHCVFNTSPVDKPELKGPKKRLQIDKGKWTSYLMGESHTVPPGENV